MSNAPSWVTDHHAVRLFPSVHIRGEEEAELRATASLLAAIRAVSDFGRRIVNLTGGPASKTSRLSCYTEVSFDLRESRNKPPEKVRPDGIVVSIRGKTRWVAFVEAKVGNTPLDEEQVHKYQRLAGQIGVDALITVSNQAATAEGTPPLNFDQRRNVPVIHFSWERLLSEAMFLSRKDDKEDKDDKIDSDQKWILDEWIRYVNDEDSGIIIPPDLGPQWSEVMRAARANRLEQSRDELESVSKYWRGFLRKAALRLRANLGVDVTVVMPKTKRGGKDLQTVNSVNLSEGTLNGTLRIRFAAGDIGMEVDLRSRLVRYVVRIDAPSEGRPKTKIRWLVRQLQSQELLGGELDAIVHWSGRGLSTSAPVREFLEHPERLWLNKDGTEIKEGARPRFFQIVWTRSLSKARGRSSTPILKDIQKGLEDFYHNVVQNIKPYQRKPARFATTSPEPDGASASEDDSGSKLNESRDTSQEPTSEV